MATTTKESVPSPSLTQDGTSAAQNAGAQAPPRTDAIGIEIPVVLYASRTSAAGRGLGKTPPPVREETRTVIVFAQGAVVRLSASISVGEMVVLTNQQTGADVLCRVGAVKTQPGIQNYVDLEFTQRAPGFWEGSSATGPSARTERPASEPAARPIATPPAILAPKQQPRSPLPTTTESLPPVAAATPVPEHAATAIPATPLATQPARLTPARPAPPIVSTSSNAVSSVSTGLPQAKSSPSTLSMPSTLTGDRADWSKQNQPSSRKGLWAAVAAVAVAGIVAGGFLLNRRGQSASPETAVTVAAPSVPVQPTARPADEPQAPIAAYSASSATAVPVQAPTWLPDTPRHEQPQAEKAAQPVPVPQATQPAQSAARRSAIAVGNLSTPIARTPTTASSSEPPPVLSTQDNAAAEGLLGTGELSGASHVEAPTAFAAAEAPTKPPAENSPGQPLKPAQPVQPVAAGGRIEAPKLISSPNPVYPATARAQSLEGVVALEALIDAAGNVTEVKAISGPILLRQAAIDALRKWKYQPGRVDGQPTAVHTNVNIRFALR